MLSAIRAHGNFAEYVPLTLLLMALCELAGVGALWLHLGGGLLLVGRILHAIGIQIPRAPNKPRLFGTLFSGCPWGSSRCWRWCRGCHSAETRRHFSAKNHLTARWFFEGERSNVFLATPCLY